MVGPRRVLWSRQLLGGVVLALLVGAPNLLYQATHGWPQLAMGRALSAANGAEVRVLMWPFLALLLGPPLVPVWCAGWVALARRPEWRPVRFLAVSFPVLLVLCAVAGGQVYYPVGLLVVLLAAGCVPVAESWRGRAGWWRPVLVAAVALNAVVSAVVALPLLPVTALGATPVPGSTSSPVTRSAGPPTCARSPPCTARCPAADRARAVVVASNYGEAGALARYGPPLRLPAVYSGHNALYDVARPPDTATVAVVVGGQLPSVARRLRLVHGRWRGWTTGSGSTTRSRANRSPCAATLSVPWAAIWPRFRHRD